MKLKRKIIKNSRILRIIFCLLFLFEFQESYAQILSHQSDESTDIKTPHIYIFVSSSMPEISLVQWMQEARVENQKGIHTALIMRGLVHDSLIETKRFVSNIVKKSEGKGGISIDPVLFEKYDIKEVPAVVVATENNADVVYGNASLNAALNTVMKGIDNKNGA